MTESPPDRAMQLLEELKTLSLPATAGRSEAQGVPGEPAGNGASAGESPPQIPAGEPAKGTTPSPPPAAEGDSPEVAIARAVVARQVEGALESAVVNSKAARAILEAEGVKLGIDDNGRPVLSKDGGDEKPISVASLIEAGVPEELIRSQGRPGTGLYAGGTAPPPVDFVEEGMKSQEFFDKNRRKVLEALTRGRKRT